MHLEESPNLRQKQFVLYLRKRCKLLKNQAKISRAKAVAITDLALNYKNGFISDGILTGIDLSDAELKNKLTSVKGIGEWSYTMFAIFELHKQDILPVHDLGVRKGIGKMFNVNGSGKKGLLDQKKDLVKIEKLVEPYKPYRSLFAWYMWRYIEVS